MNDIHFYIGYVKTNINEPDLVGNIWNTLTKTRIHDWEERFYWEERQMSIFDFLKKD